MFRKNIFTALFLKSETSAPAPVTITPLCILFADILTWYQLETYIEDPLEKWSHKVTSRIWSRDFSWKF